MWTVQNTGFTWVVLIPTDQGSATVPLTRVHPTLLVAGTQHLRYDGLQRESGHHGEMILCSPARRRSRLPSTQSLTSGGAWLLWDTRHGSCHGLKYNVSRWQDEMMTIHSRFVLPQPLTRHSVSWGKDVQGSGRQIGDAVLWWAYHDVIQCMCICVYTVLYTMMYECIFLNTDTSYHCFV